MITKIALIGAVCLLVALGYLPQQSLASASLGQMLAEERLTELEDDYKATMDSLIRRLTTSSAKDKFLFAMNDAGFMSDIQRLGSILKNIGEVKAKTDGKTDLIEAARDGLSVGLERIVDEIAYEDDVLWIIPKILENEFKLRH